MKPLNINNIPPSKTFFGKQEQFWPNALRYATNASYECQQESYLGLLSERARAASLETAVSIRLISSHTLKM